ncbi:hypothetical protein SASPL_116549 [Salvia splendens]|uniref:Uncharacterized protein n=1 Tax=Salvia splendens TaxID=180675 RepID=A0A8X8XXM5_SALSN|nr:uncharacterized protein LOC121808536 [Salvia splendens]XP_042065013.1 uncharacterized protein LOC121808536 [Salvia splendens]XP_042065014.1 uncharacterized protein LOC121808536 [Salvia splendens]XP_042065015.1 uncharacterized protein LOC121808536 [Salvia splendens]KAG6420035.1 hypothetical protein SASPL_116549 [Salvia splendens]
MAVIEVALHLHAPPFLSHRASVFLYAPSSGINLHCRPLSVSGHRFLLVRQWPLHICQCRRWDSNAEYYAAEEIEDFDEQWTAALEDYIDSIWILKVFGSYGWMLPPILLSLLLANGLKAFLLALALPIGQSTFAFAINRFQNRGKDKPKRKDKTKKRRSRVYSSRDAGSVESPEYTYGQRPQRKQKGYQSWGSKDDFTTTAADFGGWDELDSGMDYNVGGGSSRREQRKTSGSRGASAKKGGKRILRESDGPLLLRLLISVFPFLSTWTKML